MIKRSLVGEVLVAGIAAALSLPLTMILKVIGGSIAAQVLISTLALGYLAYLLVVSPSRMGRIALGVGSIVILFVICLAGVSPVGVVLLAVGLIWLVRSLLSYSSMVPALLDGLLCAVSLVGAASVLAWTGSLWLAVWSFFLPQALVVWIPRRLGLRAPAPAEPSPDTFAQAHRAAQDALHNLAHQVG